MNMKFNNPFSLVVSFVLVLVLTCARSFVIPNGGVLRRPLPSSNGLHISFWEADLMSHLEGDDPEKPGSNEDTTDNPVGPKRAKQIEIIKYNNRSNPKRWCPFYNYLCLKQRSINKLEKKAFHMDDELKRMESKFYKLEGEDLSPIEFPLGYDGFGNYEGNIVRPDVRAYELIARAYARARLGQEGVERAEDVVARYENFFTSQKATTKMMAFVMKACIGAGNLERTEYWLDRIEKRYKITKRDEDLPGYYVYNPFVKGLGKMTDISARTAAKRSMEVVEKIHVLSELTKDQDLFPGRNIYLDIIEYQELGYRGSAAFERIEKVFRELQKNYILSGMHPKLKPSVEAVAPVFAAASTCSFPRDDLVITTVNELFDDYHKLYQETGDVSFRPNGAICDSLNLIYARMNRKDLDLTEFMERTSTLIERMAEYNVQFKDSRDKTSAFNRILLAAERQLPRIPMSDPVETRKIIVTALDVFKKFHEDDSSPASVSPNKASYQIFLRLCSKLPEGETRSKLSAKAFELCRQKEMVSVDTIYKLYDANPEYALSMLKSTDNFGYNEDSFDFLTVDITKDGFHKN
mmetsp:Transcript_25127/g.59286  ORF Transcript_25127/g.59286 Transcript_25127/m.59286 type:complete len:578 (+) Transcript_25127:97-1830(+)